MAIFLPQRWNRQPQYAVGLAAPYQSAVIAGVPGVFDAASRLPTMFGNLVSDVQANGRGIRFDSANSDTPARRLEWANAAWNRLTGAHTLIASFTVRTPPTRANKGVLAKYLGAGNQRSWGLIIDYQSSATDTYIRSLVSADGTSVAGQITQTPTGPAISNGNYVAVSVFRPSTFLGLWVNGTAHASTTASVVASAFSSSADVWVGTQFSITNPTLNSEYCLAGSVQMYAVLPFAVSDAQALELSRNPWQLFRPAANQTFYSLPSQSSGTDGTLSVTLDAATLSSNATVAAGASATVSATLDAATLASNATVAAGPTATLAATLGAATLSAQADVGGGASASLTVTLDAATLAADATVAAGPSATLSVTLDAVTLSAAATAAADVTASVAATLDAVTLAADATVAAGATATLAVQLSAVTLAANGAVGNVPAEATVAVQLGDLVVAAAATVAGADAALPSPVRRIGGVRLVVGGGDARLVARRRIGGGTLRRAA